MEWTPDPNHHTQFVGTGVVFVRNLLISRIEFWGSSKEPPKYCLLMI